jgi:hypothetical protein
MATDSEIAPVLGICSIILVRRFFNSFINISIPVPNIPSQVISLGCVAGMLKQVYISQTDKMF